MANDYSATAIQTLGEAWGSNRMSAGIPKGSGRTARGANPGEIEGYAVSTLKGSDSNCSTLAGFSVRGTGDSQGFTLGCSVSPFQGPVV